SAQEQQRRIEPATNRRFEPEEDYDYVEVEQRRDLDEDLDAREPERARPAARYAEERLEPESYDTERMDRSERFQQPERLQQPERFEQPERDLQPRLSERPPARRYVRDDGPVDVEPLDGDPW
ncbi:MAG: hypothetical protein ACKOFN_08335, partial [Vulcanococcus sp.]